MVRVRVLLCLALSILLDRSSPAAVATSPSAPATPLPGYLRWRNHLRRVDADIQSWTLQQTLERIATATGWEVRAEPGLKARIGARFTDRPEREALAALLSDVSFMLLPSTNGPPRLLVFRSNASGATEEIRPATAETEGDNATGRIDKELIVRLKPGSKETIQQLAAKLGARVAGSIDSLNAHRLVFDDADAANRARSALATDDNVAGVESNYAVGAPGRVDPVAGATAPTLNLRARPMSDSSSVIVALLDTGLPTGSSAHQDFLLPGINIAGQANASTESGLTHGPAMFDTILQGLSISQTGTEGQPVRILPIDVYGGRAETSTFEVAQGIVAALEKGADIINLSLSGPNPSPIVRDVIQQATAAGVLTFAAPGNEPTTQPNYPAAYPEVTAVTASDRRGQVAAYANRGSFVDLIAPGTSVVPYAGKTFVVNGTSVSTAYTSGLAAGLLADSGRNPKEVLALLQERLAFQPPANPTPAPSPTTP